MDHPAIFSATLGLSSPWHILSVSFAEEGRMDITVEVHPGSLFCCPSCGSRKAPSFSEEETWYHDNFFRYATYLHAHVPRLACCGGIFALDRPWSRAGSRFERLLSGAPESAPVDSHGPREYNKIMEKGSLKTALEYR